jgi:hypothetical protein
MSCFKFSIQFFQKISLNLFLFLIFLCLKGESTLLQPITVYGEKATPHVVNLSSQSFVEKPSHKSFYETLKGNHRFFLSSPERGPAYPYTYGLGPQHTRVSYLGVPLNHMTDGYRFNGSNMAVVGKKVTHHGGYGSSGLAGGEMAFMPCDPEDRVNYFMGMIGGYQREVLKIYPSPSLDMHIQHEEKNPHIYQGPYGQKIAHGHKNFSIDGLYKNHRSQISIDLYDRQQPINHLIPYPHDRGDYSHHQGGRIIHVMKIPSHGPWSSTWSWSYGAHQNQITEQTNKTSIKGHNLFFSHKQTHEKGHQWGIEGTYDHGTWGGTSHHEIGSHLWGKWVKKNWTYRSHINQRKNHFLGGLGIGYHTSSRKKFQWGSQLSLTGQHPGLYDRMGDGFMTAPNPHLKSEKILQWIHYFSQEWNKKMKSQHHIAIHYLWDHLKTIQISPQLYQRVNEDHQWVFHTGTSLDIQWNNFYRTILEFSLQGGPLKIGIPSYQGSLKIVWKPSSKWDMITSVSFFSKRWDRNFGSFPAPLVSLNGGGALQIQGSYKVSSSMRFFIEVDDLQTKGYTHTHGFGGPKPSISVGCRITW